MRYRPTARASITLAVLVVVVVCLVWFLSAEHQTAPEIRSVVLISIDTCRADRLSCYGFDRKTTPNIDAVASEGVVFSRAHSTNSMTLPAHSSMLTGTIPPFHGVHDNISYRLGDSNVTLAEIMRDNNFQTAAFVSAVVLDAKFGLDQGFQTYDDQVATSRNRLLINERKAADTSQQAMTWLDEHGREPFFLFLHYYDPHDLYAPPEPFASIYAEDLYAGEIAYTDQCIGQVIEKLKALGIYDSTLLMITSDHGESLGEHGERTHAYFIYQSTIHVPLIIKAPGGAQGRTVDALTSIVDLVPTVLSLLGIPQPPQIQGEDLSGCLFDKGRQTDDRSLYCESLYPTSFGCSEIFGLIDGSWKYIWTKRPELYDLGRDPAEAKNLIEAEPDIAVKLQARLRNMLGEQARSDLADSRASPDRERIARLETLGYVGGGVESTRLEVDLNGEDPKDFIGLYERLMNAHSLRGHGQFEAARLKCLEVLSQRPGHLHTHYMLGEILGDEGRYADAVPHFSRYLEGVAGASDVSSRATSSPAKYQLSLAHYNLGVALQALGRAQESLGHYQEALRIKPDYAEAHNNLGVALQALGRAQESLGHYQEALRLKPDYAEAHNNCGNALSVFRRPQEAVAHYQEALRIKPDYALAHYNLGNALQGLSRLEEAVAHYQDVVRIKPNHAQAHYNLGLALQELGRPQEALAHYQETLRIKPDYAAAHFSLGLALKNLERIEEAVPHYQAALRLVPNLAEAHLELGYALNRLGRAEEAVSHYREALRIKPKLAEAHLHLGLALQSLDRIEQAVAHYQESLKLKPNDSDALNNLAWVLASCWREKVRDGRQAVELAERAARQTAHKNPSILDTLSAAYAEAGNFEQAVEWQQKAVELAPEQQKDVLNARLELYKQGKPFREKPQGRPFREEPQGKPLREKLQGKSDE